MPKPIDEQIRMIEERILRDKKKLKELKKQKEAMILRAVSVQKKKEVTELMKKGKPSEEILSILKSNH